MTSQYDGFDAYEQPLRMVEPVSKWCGAIYSHQMIALGVLKLQRGGMQAQPFTQSDHAGGCIQGIAQHGVANVRHVNTQLVRAARNRLQPQFGASRRNVLLIRSAQVARLAGFAFVQINNLQGSVFPVAHQRGINKLPGFGGDIAVHDGRIAFVNFTGGKSIAQLALHFFAARKQQQT